MQSTIAYWHKVTRLSEEEKTADANRQRLFRETNDPTALEGQTLPGGDLYMTTIPNEERCVEGGKVFAIPQKYVGVKLADRTHRRATAQEIEAEFQRQDAQKVHAEKMEDALNNRRTVHVRAVEPLSRRGA
jgi:hypothetical protein